MQEWVVAEMPGQCAGAWVEKPMPLLSVSRIGAEERRRSRADSSFRRRDGVLIW